MTTPTSKAPYKIMKRAGNFVVVNNGNEVKAKFTDRDKAVQYLRALYSNVPNAAKRAAKVAWTGKQKRAVAAADTGPWTARQLWHAAVDGGWQRVSADMSSDADTDEDAGTMAAAIDALLDEVLAMLNAVPDADLSPELRQAIDLLNGAEPITDQLLELLGVDDPDDEDDTAKQAAAFTPGVKGVNPFAKKSDTSVAAGDFADPGYQKDKVKRYPIDTAAHVRSAWAYINQSGNAAKYTPAQREAIKARIRTAAKKLKVDIAESAMSVGQTLEQRVAAHVDSVVAGAVEEAVVTVQHKSKPGKHRFVSHTHVHSAMYRGPGWGGICVACGNPASDPDHDGNLDNPPPPIPVAAQDDTFGVIGWPSTTQFTMNVLGTSAGTCAGTSTATVTLRPTGPLEGMVLAPIAPTEIVAPPAAVKAFLTEVHGKTMITGPASTFVPPAWEKALTPNKHMLWLQGRFVGAEKANRNGAFWSTADLELGETTVKYGPLNWLHEAKHIIGTIADTRLVAHDTAKDQPLAEPYIQAASAIWSWIYRDEASVVEMASDSGKLWYSMECISENVECAGDKGCGVTIPYMEYVSGEKACEHMLAHTATRRFADPTFLGGAVIMPPARPGWAEADAQVMREAASLAEDAFEQAGQPDVSASEWEQMMAAVVRFAG